MKTRSQGSHPWNTVQYQRISTARFQDGIVVVEFEDGSVARVQTQFLVACEAPEPDWPNLRSDEFHLIVPSRAGDIEIPWDVVRVHSDPAYDAFLAELSATADVRG